MVMGVVSASLYPIIFSIFILLYKVPSFHNSCFFHFLAFSMYHLGHTQLFIFADRYAYMTMMIFFSKF